MTTVDAEVMDGSYGSSPISAELVPADSAVLDAMADPGTAVVAMLDRAKSWLAQATLVDLPEIVENKARAEAIRCYIAQKELGKDAELAAQEIVRRAERRIGVLIREGQADGEIARQGQGGGDPPGASRPRRDTTLSAPEDFASRSELSGQCGDTGIYAMTDGVSDDQFEEAITEAKEEKNLSRANVARKAKAKAPRNKPQAERAKQIAKLAAKGFTSRQIGVKIGISDEQVRVIAKRESVEIPADATVTNTRRIDHNRIVSEAATMLDGLVLGLSHVDLTQLDPKQVAGWASSIATSLSSLTTFKNQLKKEEARGLEG